MEYLGIVLNEGKSTREMVFAFKDKFPHFSLNWKILAKESTRKNPHHELSTEQLEKCFGHKDIDVGLACRMLYDLAAR